MAEESKGWWDTFVRPFYRKKDDAEQEQIDPAPPPVGNKFPDPDEMTRDARERTDDSVETIRNADDTARRVRVEEMARNTRTPQEMGVVDPWLGQSQPFSGGGSQNSEMLTVMREMLNVLKEIENKLDLEAKWGE